MTFDTKNVGNFFKNNPAIIKITLSILGVSVILVGVFGYLQLKKDVDSHEQHILGGKHDMFVVFNYLSAVDKNFKENIKKVQESIEAQK